MLILYHVIMMGLVIPPFFYFNWTTNDFKNYSDWFFVQVLLWHLHLQLYSQKFVAQYEHLSFIMG